MLLFFLCFLTALLMAYLVRVIQLEGNGPNSFVVMPLVLGILAVSVLQFLWSNGESKGSHLVTYVSGVTNSSLKCQSLPGALYDYNPEHKGKGYIDKNDPKTVHIKYSECKELMNWFNSEITVDPASSKQAFALHLLIFEATKVGTNIGDAEAECAATARYVEVAKYAGASTEEAARMLDMYKSDWYPYLDAELRQPCK